MYKKFLLLLFLIASFVINSLYAQSTGKIMGKVIDASTDEGIPFANVLIDGTSLGAASDVEGNFVILNIPPGLYNVTASYIGYQKVTIKDITVNVGFTTSLDFKLNPGEITLEAVVVQGDRDRKSVV